MSTNRKASHESIKSIPNCKIITLDSESCKAYEVAENPFHPAFDLLSEVHRGDYMQVYLLLHYGGGYTNVKKYDDGEKAKWAKAFETLRASGAQMVGYPERPVGGVAYPPNCPRWREATGVCAWVAKRDCIIMRRMMHDIHAFLDGKLDELKVHPPSHARDCKEISNYPIEWNQIMGRNFHRISFDYLSEILRTGARPSFELYI